MGNLGRWAWCALCAAGIATIAACHGGSSTGGTGAADGQGVLRVPLRARSASGHTFDLRDATFTVAGEHGEEELVAPQGAEFAELELSAGRYTVALRPGWRVVRTDEALGTHTPAEASVQASELPLRVLAGEASEARYSFAIVGESSLVQFGQLLIGVEVVEASGPSSCPSCDDGNPCTYDGCDGPLACTHRPIAAGSLCPAGTCDPMGTCVVDSTPTERLTVLKNYSGRSLNGANFRDADLRRVNFEGARLRGADFAGSDLRDANLTNTDLRYADLRGAKLEGADLTGARTSGAHTDIRSGL